MRPRAADVIESATDAREVARLRARVARLEEDLAVQERVAFEQYERTQEVLRWLARSEANFKTIIERLPNAIFVHREHVALYANPAMASLLGYETPGLLVGENILFAFIHPADRARVRAFRRRAEAGGPVGTMRVRWIHRQGGEIVVEGFSTAITFDGKPAVLTIATDITERLRFNAERKTNEMELRVSEERYRALFEHSPLPKMLFDRETLRILAVNGAAVRLYGYAREELLSMKLTELKVEDDPELHVVMAALRAEPQRHDAELGSPWRGTKKHRKKDGTTMELEITAHAVMLSGRPAMLATAIDVTEKRLLEEQLRQAQKMDAVGQLAGGIAHDFNNLLSVILSYANLMLDEIEPMDPLRADVEQVKRAGERACGLTRQLLTFSRKQMLEPRVVDLNHIVGGMEKMLKRLLGEDIELVLTTGDKLGRVFVDPGQIEQVVMNLAVNARDATPRGGKLTLEIANTELDDAYAAAHPDVAPGRYVMLAMTDTGVGMDEATKARVFEPFFTTKERGKGTGLGLSTVFGIVRQSGGHVSLRSEVGRGTCFEIYFPRTDHVDDRPVSTPPSPVMLRGTETVLLVEDEEQVRGTLRTILRRQGYRVLEAQNGGEAFLMCEKHPDEIHLLLTDVVMPRMSGVEVVERLRPMRPDMKILYVSGYAASERDDALESGGAFLQKPITPEALSRKVREVLSSSRR